MHPKVSVFIATSIDVFIAREGGGLDWLDLVQVAGEDYGFGAFFVRVDTLVLGRKTWETALGFPEWPYAGKRVVVLTRDKRTGRHGEEFTAEQPDVLLRRLQREGSRHVYVDGGETIRSFLAHDLIDEMTLSVVPILLGCGVPLFGSGVPESRWKFIESKAFPSGLVQSRYGTQRPFSAAPCP